MAVKLNEEERERLQELFEELGAEPAAKKLYISPQTMMRAAAGGPINGSTAALIRLRFQSDDRRQVIAERSRK